jgi:hypothetical protein
MKAANVIIIALVLGLPVLSSGQGAGTDPFGLSQLKDFQAYRSSSNNPDLFSNDDSKRPIPGETIVLADLKGPGVVTHIWLTIAANEYGWPRLLRFRVYYDDSPTASVDAPVGDFFAVGHGFERTVNSLMVVNSSSGRSRNCYWPMPFRKSCRITITNEGRRRVSNVYYHVDWKKVPALAPDTAYFHALYRQALPAASGKPYEVLRVDGRGHYVGTVFSVIQREPGWFGEGDDFFYVDGNPVAVAEGTGTEDYFNDAWSLRVGQGPYTGVPVAEGTGLGSRMTAYRWHLLDPVPFQRSFRLDFEHAGWTYNSDGSVRSAFEERADLFSSVAFWYQKGVAQALPVPPSGAARLPQGNARQIEVEDLLPQVRAEKGKASVQKEVFWSKDILFFEASGPGAKVTVPFDVDEDGSYELIALLAHAPDYGNYVASIDGKSAAERGDLEHEPGANTGVADQMQLYHTELYVAEDHLVGWLKLGKGRHELTLECVGKNSASAAHYLGMDSLILSRVAERPPEQNVEAGKIRSLAQNRETGPESLALFRNGLASGSDEIREAAAWAMTQTGQRSAEVVNDLNRALSDRDAVVRGLAALALRNSGKQAFPALAGLIGCLRDEDPNVRLMSAQAVGAIGSGAASLAVAPLTAACRIPGEQVHVLRSLADALGAMGREASSAVPALKELAKMPRVRWPAEAAIRKITAAP